MVGQPAQKIGIDAAARVANPSAHPSAPAGGPDRARLATTTTMTAASRPMPISGRCSAWTAPVVWRGLGVVVGVEVEDLTDQHGQHVAGETDRGPDHGWTSD